MKHSILASPDISVVVPTRGRPRLLQRAIESVLHQTLQNFEVLVVIDGPDSITAEAVKQYGDPRIRLIELDHPVGAAEARNVGARQARSRYVALLDDDDEWLSTKLSSQLALAENHLGFNFIVVTQYLYRVELQPDEVWPAHLPRVNEPLSEFLFSSCGGFQTSTYLCPRELLLRVPFTAGLKKHQDWDWFLQVAALHGFELLIVPQPLSIYWVPQRTRSSISGQFDWKFSHRWVNSRRSLITCKAYARFLVKICVRSAMMEAAGPAALWKIFCDFLSNGWLTPSLLAEFLLSVLLSEPLRARLRKLRQSRRKPRLLPVVH